jgi:hypothetical protein
MTTRICLALLLLTLAAPLLAACQAVDYKLDAREVALLPRDNALRYLQSLPGEYYGVVSLRPDDEHCEFNGDGLRVAQANPRYAEAVEAAQQQVLRGIAAQRPAAEAELRRVQDETRDFGRWLQMRGYPDLLAEERRLADDHSSAERWLRLRGMPADQIEKAKVEIDSEKKGFASRLSAARSGMEGERATAESRIRDLDRQADKARDTIASAKARVHDFAPYRDAGFVVYTFFSRMTVDLAYRRPVSGEDSCGFRLDNNQANVTPIMQRLATALAALGAEPQAGVSAAPPKH